MCLSSTMHTILSSLHYAQYNDLKYPFVGLFTELFSDELSGLGHSTTGLGYKCQSWTSDECLHSSGSCFTRGGGSVTIKFQFKSILLSYMVYSVDCEKLRIHLGLENKPNSDSNEKTFTQASFFFFLLHVWGLCCTTWRTTTDEQNRIKTWNVRWWAVGLKSKHGSTCENIAAWCC